MSQIPEAKVIEVIPTPTTRLVRIDCPYCHNAHTHGWPYEDGNKQPGHRISHCLGPKGVGYDIVVESTS